MLMIVIFTIKKQFITNGLTNYIYKKSSIHNNENVSNIEDFSTKHYITNAFRSSNDYIGNNVYKKYDNRTFNNTNHTSKHINNYSNDVINNYKIE